MPPFFCFRVAIISLSSEKETQMFWKQMLLDLISLCLVLATIGMLVLTYVALGGQY